jgi:Zn-dependent protease with chaperone function
MDQELKSNFDEFEKSTVIRRKLLPWWIKTFCWIFMILAVCGLASLIGNAFTDNVELSFYGFSSNTAYSGIGIFIIAVMALKGFAAYSLWFEKDNAISIAKIDAIVGVVICLASMFILPFTKEDGHFPLRLEILLLIPYYIKVNKIEYAWDNRETI